MIASDFSGRTDSNSVGRRVKVHHVLAPNVWSFILGKNLWVYICMRSKTTIALEPEYVAPLRAEVEASGRSPRLWSFLSNKSWEARYLNHVTFISAKTLRLLHNSGGRRRPLHSVDFLLISMCGVVYWKRKISTRLILEDTEIVHLGWMKLIYNYICQFFIFFIFALTFRVRKFKQEQQQKILKL